MKTRSESRGVLGGEYIGLHSKTLSNDVEQWEDEHPVSDFALD